MSRQAICVSYKTEDTENLIAITELRQYAVKKHCTLSWVVLKAIKNLSNELKFTDKHHE